MAEVVDAVLSEDTPMPPIQSQPQSLPATMESNASMSKINNGSVQSSGDHLNGDKKTDLSDGGVEAMAVDVPDTDGDDSQVTSSTENGNGAAGDGSKSKNNIAAKQPPIHTLKENSTDSTSENPSTPTKDKSELAQSPKSSNEVVSSIASAPKRPERADEKISGIVAGINSNESRTENPDNNSVAIGPPVIASGNGQSSDMTITTDDQLKDEPDHRMKENIAVEVKLEKSSPDTTPMYDSTAFSDTSKNPLRDDRVNRLLFDYRPNGTVSESEKDDTGIVDLGDDTDEDTIESSSKPPQQTHQQNNEPAKSESAVNLSVNKAKSVGSDSDGPVIIGSDSENEVDRTSQLPPSKPVEQKVVCRQEIEDDDDDDCVVIEDDTPAPNHAEVSKRKTLPGDTISNLDDSQPPNKRQRTSMPLLTNQITIKDARSLMPQEIATLKESNDSLGVYPVNIRTAGSVPGPPKLVPVSNSTNFPLSALPGLNANTNLLPGLTDDMYVLEAPSFIVPYIYEKPPVDNLREIVKEIEAKYHLSKEDLAEVDKPDEFDMMTEQNKEEKEEKSGKKKKKRRGGGDPDESWSEESEEDDDEEEDDDSDSGLRTKVLIKEADDDLTVLKGAIKSASTVAGTPTAATPGSPGKPGQEDYFESPLGKFFMDIGVGLVQEFVQSDLIRLQKRKMRKSLGKNIMEFERAIAALSGNLDASKKKNSAFKFTMKRCEFCNFKSESALSMANHYETPHMNGLLYKCNFCAFEIRNANEIVYHMEAVHNIKARLIKPLPYHQCPNCGFEDNGKAKLARHQPVCAKKFRPEFNLAPPHDWEAPAKIPRIKPRHGLVGTATAYQAMAAQAAAQKAALASIQQQQQQAAQARSMQAAALAAQNAANKIRSRAPTVTKQSPSPTASLIRGPNQIRSPMPTNVVMPNNYQLAGAQLIQNTANANVMAKKTLSGQPSISITPLPRQGGSALAPSPSSSKMPPVGMKPGQSPAGNKAQFVICEICDGYIKDLEQLRNHMQWMHKVKIHPKMIYNRPPLNCQKCQFRFFTDQGLERHLLGSHGLVTSSMQEAANKGKDAGRCPVCGRLYQWKLLNHVSRDHHMTLKPAHLSYKCTVCTATFGMYKQFETHVYTAHSTVAKKAMDGKKNHASASSSSTMSVGNQRSSFGATNESLLKPLKINDEITIIPQPASKPRITNMESHVID